MKILVYTPKITPRIEYTFSLFFNYLGKLNYEITCDPEYVEFHQGPVLNYSQHKHDKSLWFPPARILFETGLNDEELNVVNDKGLKGAFPTPKNPHLKFDIFASAFFLVSRYEEYLPHLRDQYNRFDAHYSFAFKSGFLRVPMANYYAEFLFSLLEKEFPTLKITRNKYRFLNTIDVDNAYAYVEKGLIRTTGAYARDILTGNLENLKYRTRVLQNKLKDPYDNFQYLLDLQKKYKIRSIYFFLLADYGLNDKNVPIWSKRFQSLIQSISDRAEVGIHPSFGSNKNAEKLTEEIKRLSEITKFEITKSRQHFLILNLPETYRRLMQNEITDDFSMGFASEAGFRASICIPYPFYDIDIEATTQLIIHPFAMMEATLNHYMNLKPDAACELIKDLVQEVKKVNGTFVGLWHNETLSDRGMWKGWRAVYEYMLLEALK